MNFKEFEEKYKPLVINDKLQDWNKYVASKWPDTRVMLKKDNSCIWSVIKKEGKLYIYPDLHFYGLQGNIVTEIPFGDKNLIIEIDEKES